MTYKDFCDIVYEVDKEEDYYCYACATTFEKNPRYEEVRNKYEYYVKKHKKINDFKRKVLTEALKNLSKDFFEIF